MALDPQQIAAAMGAVHVGQVPDVGGGAFGAAHLAAIFKERLERGQGHWPGRLSPVRWTGRLKVPLSHETEQQLILLAEQLSSPESRVSPVAGIVSNRKFRI
jgi:hypothetical protein